MKKYYVITKGIIEYVLIKKGDIYKLKFSKNKEWTSPGETILKVIDTGEGFNIIFNEITDLNSQIGYDTGLYLSLIFQFIHKKDKNFAPKYKFKKIK